MDRSRTALLALSLALLAVASPGGLTAAEDEARPLDATTRDFHQQHIEVRVKPDIVAGTVQGRTRLRFESLADGLTTLRLHSLETKVASVAGPSGGKLSFKHKKGILSIRLAGPLAKGAVSTVEIVYSSKPTRGLYFHKPTQGCPDTPLFMYSQGQGTDNRRWIPCYDEPDDRLSWDIFVTAPKSLSTVSNGVLVGSEEQGGERVDHWKYAARAPSYLMSLIVAPLETVTTKWREVQLDFSAVRGRTEELKTSLAETANMMEFFSNYLQAPYPWPRYAQTYVWDFVYGGMENVTATTLNMRALHTKAARPNYRSDGLVAHELAHMWFGDLLTCRTWKHIWLNEGFATYFTDLFFEDRYGREEFLLRRRNQNRGYMRGTPKAGDLKLQKDPRGDIPLELFGGKQYSRGAAILNNLRRHVGDELFRDSIREYVKRHRDSGVTSEDLRTAVEDVAGEDLGWFWDQWVYGLGYPKLDVRFDKSARQLIVRQLQKRANGQGLFRIRIPIRWGKDGPVQMRTVYKERHAFPFPNADGGTFLRFGVGGDLLMKVTLHQSVSAWGQALAGDPDLTGRLDAADALEEFGEAAAPALAQSVQNDASWAVRETCAKILGRIEGPGVVEGLLAAASDPDSRVRVAVMDSLGAKNRRVAGAAVAKAAREDSHPYVRAAAARAAGKLKVKDAFDLLTGLLSVDSVQDVVRTGAVDGLKHLGKQEAVPSVLPFLHYHWGKGANHVLRQAAFNCVTALKPDDAGVHAAVVALLDDPYHRMRQWSAQAAGKYKIRAAIPTLQRLRKSDWNGGVKGAARKALERLEVKPAPRKGKKKKDAKKKKAA